MTFSYFKKNSFPFIFSALLLAGCQSGGIVSHQDFHERAQHAKEQTDLLAKRYQTLKNQEISVLGTADCPFLVKEDQKTEKLIHRLTANAVHPHNGQSTLHVPNHSELAAAGRDLDKLSVLIEKCRAQPKTLSEFKKEEIL